jgi:hypothetical protein
MMTENLEIPLKNPSFLEYIISSSADISDNWTLDNIWPPGGTYKASNRKHPRMYQ